MSFFDAASLVTIPSGYKTSKVYSVKPADGSGDLTFTRSNATATRVGPDGLIEKVRTNLVLNSATFVTQTITVGANPHTISFTGTGTIVITGVGTATLVGTGAANRVSLSFTTTAGALILTGTGTITLAQLETGDIATPYIATLGTAVSVGPVANVPRLDYLNSSCPKLLLEPQRSNVCPFSEQFNNAAWLTVEATITPNAIAAPDGTVSADLILDNAVSDQHAVYEGISSGAGVHTWSVFAKAQNLNFLIVNAFSGSDNRTWFNLSNGTVGTNAAGNTATITDYGNGWYRCTVSRSYASGTFLFVAATAPSDGVFSYVGSGNGLYLWGAQVEAGAYPSSYIPTLGAAVTRGADACSKTSATALIGQTEGTLFTEMEVINGIENVGIWIRQSGSFYDNAIEVTFTNLRASRAAVANGGVGQVDISGPVVSAGFHKIAFAYKANDFALYVDGVQVATDSSGTVPTCNEIYIDQYIDSGVRNATKKQAILFKTRLSNADLAALTA